MNEVLNLKIKKKSKQNFEINLEWGLSAIRIGKKECVREEGTEERRS